MKRKIAEILTYLYQTITYIPVCKVHRRYANWTIRIFKIIEHLIFDTPNIFIKHPRSIIQQEYIKIELIGVIPCLRIVLS